MDVREPAETRKRQDRALKTRASLLLAGEREFSKRGYAATTAKTIAARARAATGSFYQYFSSKDEVLRELAKVRQAALAERALEVLEQAPADLVAIDDVQTLVRDVKARLRSVVELVIAYHAEDPGLHSVLTERRHADPELDAIYSRAEAELVERITALLARWGHDGDRAATAFILFTSVEGAVHTHVLGHKVIDDARFLDALVEALLRIALPFSPIQTRSN